MSSYLGDKLISGAEQFVGESRNIGQIIPSTIPLTDAGLHLLDGSLILGGGIYNAFVDYITGLDLTANYFCTEAEWQQSITDYGVCGKFVYDSVNNTVRLPKITGIIEGTTDVTALSDLVEAGLPNITGQFGINTRWSQADMTSRTSGAFDKVNQGTPAGASSSGDFGGYVTFNASRSSSVYGNSSTVQPQTIKVLYYIVIATSTKTDIQVDIDEVVTDLNGKADTDLSDVNNTGYIKMAGAGMPSNTYINLTLGASGSTYTAPANGWFCLSKKTNGANQVANLINFSSSSIRTALFSPVSGADIYIYLPARKGDVIASYYSAGGTTEFFRFIYAQGSESEVQ